MTQHGEIDLAIRGGIVVTAEGELEADVLIARGRIAGLVAPGAPASAAETLDARGLHALPGVIDPHIHLPNRGRTYAQSCATVSRTEVAGGTTAAMSFIFASERTSSYLPVVEEMATALREHSLVDMAAAPIIMSLEHVAEMPALVEAGVPSFKVFMANAGSHEMYAKTWSVDDGIIWTALRQAARLQPHPLIHVHAENLEIALALTAELKAEGRKDPAAWTAARPNLCEEDSLRQFALWVERSGGPGYAVHLTTREAPGIIAEARARGAAIYGETCPQYLTCYDTHAQAAMAKYQPAIKTREDAEALWAAIADGRLHCVGSDHIPLNKSEKLLDQDIWGVSLGTPSSGTILPVMLEYGVHQGRISLSDVVRVTSANTSRILGFHPQKGNLLPGADADLVLVDLKRDVTVTAELLNVDFTLYEGERFHGWPRLTLVGGRVVCEDGQVDESAVGARLLRSRLPARPAII